jgi:zinc protease
VFIYAVDHTVDLMSTASNGVTTKHVLSNGMVLLLREVHTAPVISWWVLYRVGSRNEPTGRTGASHWVEHMLFKGTDAFPDGFLDRAIERDGGFWNAQTSYDCTAYYETMPADKIDLALRAEADRMMNARFDPAEVDTERTVIISERQGSENDPFSWLGEEVQAAAFRVHGYHHQIIGDMTDLETMTRDDLYGHYRTYYVPSNAIGALVGDFDTAHMITRLEELFGGFPAMPSPPAFMRPEPLQTGERRVRVERPGPERYIAIAYKSPPVRHEDWIKLYMLDCILGGASGFGGGGVGNRTSRLYQALVKTEMVASISSGLNESIDPFLYSVDAVLREESSLEAVEAAILAEIDKAANGDITQAELEKAIKQARALLAYSGETVTNQAFWLAYFEYVAGDYNWLLTLESRLRQITLADLQYVAQTYLRPSQRTVGWFIPTAPTDIPAAHGAAPSTVDLSDDDQAEMSEDDSDDHDEA